MIVYIELDLATILTAAGLIVGTTSLVLVMMTRRSDPH
jgi:hypothetical protein